MGGGEERESHVLGELNLRRGSGVRSIMGEIMIKYLIAVDPSVNHCGCAIFIDDELDSFGLVSSKKSSYLDRMQEVFDFIRLKKEYLRASIALEVPQYWGAAGYLARESGSIFKLTFLCGMIYGLSDVTMYTPNDWKGQLPKNAVKNRLSKLYANFDFSLLDHNVIDAIGIGHFHLNKKI